MLHYIIPFIISFILTICITPKIRRLALKHHIVDAPIQERKIQKGHVPLLGGVAIFIGCVVSMIVSWLAGWLDDGIIHTNKILAILIGGLILIVIGVIDDKYDIGTKSFYGPLIVAVVAVALGVGIDHITNPFVSGTAAYGRALFYFDWLKIGKFNLVAPLISFLWLLGMMYTTKFLDGLDGLVSGIGAIGAIIVFIVSLFWDVPQSGTSILCLILAGSCLGFLIFNFHPAKIFLGESGSVFIGFMLGTLSVISGGKIATALLIMGIPILDVIWVIVRRIFRERKSPFAADKKHLHFRLLDVGFSHRGAVLFLYCLSLIFGLTSLFLQSQHKVMAFGILVLIMIVLGAVLVYNYRKKVEIRN